MNDVAKHTEKNTIGKLKAKIEHYDTTSLCRSITYNKSDIVDIAAWNPIYNNILKEMILLEIKK